VKYLQDVNIREKTVFIRVDFNVPLDKNRNITDDTRIRAVLPTVNYCLDEDAKVILASHLGRPKGPDQMLSLAPVARRLGRLLHKNVKFVPDCIGPEVQKAESEMQPRCRSWRTCGFTREEKNDPEFAATHGGVDVYINALGVGHPSPSHAVVQLPQWRRPGFSCGMKSFAFINPWKIQPGPRPLSGPRFQ
jgi:phosphoglycerate kinase